ncbi:MAG: 5-(carboxyamino)imidazole ribonucleotide synthase [Steroidobacteraceae bacterium]|nr:5-(carboxyamino)imidazole ribonucleotide synthase [Steroidobacteraceae bacterium]MDW8258086.1 5-(carboxyamino)imidazole ribonucleotide synthase [Gammaproteobacteria bacterium]
MRVGVVGAGQLGRMLALAGYPLGIECLFLDRDARTPAGQVAPILVGEFTDRRLLRRLAARCEVITFDWENIPLESLRGLERRTRIAPPLAALAAGQDRLAEKRLFETLGIPTTRYAAIDTQVDLERAARRIGLPAVLKTRRLGYDGKGQYVLRRREDLADAWRLLGGQPLLFEEFVPFDSEVSIIGARSMRGEIAIYPLNRNWHVDGILRLTRAPAGAPQLERRAQRYLRRMLRHFAYTGVLTIEFFVRGGRLIANEIAPRVHNSGHWTIEGAETSQFENHLRAILGLPLGSTRARGHSAMVNLIGRLPSRTALLALPGVHWHDYGKAPRPGRKLGHLTAVLPSGPQRDRVALQLLRRASFLDNVPRRLDAA